VGSGVRRRGQVKSEALEFRYGLEKRVLSNAPEVVPGARLVRNSRLIIPAISFEFEVGA